MRTLIKYLIVLCALMTWGVGQVSAQSIDYKDNGKLSLLNDKCREMYTKEYFPKSYFKSFAIKVDVTGVVNGCAYDQLSFSAITSVNSYTVGQGALARCASSSGNGNCVIFAENDAIVWAGSNRVSSNIASAPSNSISTQNLTIKNAEEELRQKELLIKADQERRQRELQAKVDEERRQKEVSLKAEAERNKKDLVVRDDSSDKERMFAAQLSRLADENEKLRQQLANATTSRVTQSNRKALVIGNDSYRSVTRLVNAREDARAIANNLQKVGYTVSLRLDLTEKQLREAFRVFKNQVNPGDEVAIFYAGHGVQIGSTNYLLPIDVEGDNEEQIRDEAFPLQRLLDDMSDKRAKFTLAMLDACRDNPFKNSGRAVGNIRGLAPTSAATGQMIIFSAGTGQQALDKLGPTDKSKNGLFTRVFLDQMHSPGLSIDRIVKNVRNEVAKLAQSIGHEQVPAIYDQVLGEFYFSN